MDLQDGLRPLISAGLSTAICMGFWVLWLRTRKRAYRSMAFGIGLLPVGFIALVIVARVVPATGVVHSFETYAVGPERGVGMIVRELAFPVQDPEIEHLLEITPVLDRVKLKNANGDVVESGRSVSGEVLQVEFETRTAGRYRKG